MHAVAKYAKGRGRGGGKGVTVLPPWEIREGAVTPTADSSLVRLLWRNATVEVQS